MLESNFSYFFLGIKINSNSIHSILKNKKLKLKANKINCFVTSCYANHYLNYQLKRLYLFLEQYNVQLVFLYLC